jgi:tetratricopeptide (TPR) repeat protein
MLIRAVLCTAAAVALAATQSSHTAPQLTTTEAIAAYSHGDYSRFFEFLEQSTKKFDKGFHDFERDASAWMRDGTQQQPDRRRLIVATVALEIAHALRNEPADHAGEYLVWASDLMQDASPDVDREIQHLWYLASIAGMQELEPWVLAANEFSGNVRLHTQARKLGPGGQLARGLARFPDEPRFKLGQALSRYAFQNETFVPDFFAWLREMAAQRDNYFHYDAIEALGYFDKIPSVIEKLQPLSAYPELTAEVELHLGYLEAGQMHWQAALRHLQAASLTNEVYIRFLSQYVAGTTFRRMGDHASARASFERAAAIVPNARSASTQLAVELLLTDDANDRARAYPLLQAAYSDNGPADPWLLFYHGDARLWPTFMARLRKALLP